MPSDPYSVLGVSRTASADDIKKAYRKLAHQHHPDKKHGNEAKFKEINEAYQTLSDPDKKARYDQFGHMGNQGSGFGGQGQGFQDFNFDFGGSGGGFESIFDMFSGGGVGRQRAEKGEDIHLQISVASRDLGAKKTYEFEAFIPCSHCRGTGAHDAKLIECTQCSGQGRIRKAVRTPFGTFAQVVVCSTCGGDGQTPQRVCDRCNGAGRLKKKRTLEIALPARIADRYLMAFSQEGNAGPQGSPPGDLLVTIRVR
jgi:molecular chaperone DnaJ